METVLNMVIDPDNVRMVLLVVFGWSGFVLIKGQVKEMGHSLNKRIDALDHKIDMVELSLNKRIDELKHNDFAHLNDTIQALTYALEKNVDSRLA